MVSTDPQLRRLARQLTGFDKRLHDLETVPQLAHSSIDDGTLPVYDKDGTLVVAVGRQPDGTWGAPPLAGPVPSPPVGISATGGAGIVHVRWSGDYEQGGAAPLDFDALEVLVDDRLAGAIPNRDGGSITIEADQGTRFISARIRTLVPRHSSTTSPFAVEVGPPADQLFLDAREAIEAAEDQIQAGKDALDAERLAREAALAEAAETLTELEERLDGIADSEELEELRGQIAAAQEAVEQAQADATAAGEAVAGAAAEATAAKAAAETANDNALAAAGIARDKGRIYYQPTAPTDEEAKSPNNLWIDSDDGRVYVWNGTAWTESESESLRDAAQAALVAQQTAEAADSKAQQAVAAAAEADRKAGEAADAAEDAAAAAAAAQQTADDATIDAREAHNEAVAAAARAEEIRLAGENLLTLGGFESGTLEEIFSGSGSGDLTLRWTQLVDSEPAHEGSRFIRLAGDAGNAAGWSGSLFLKEIPVTPGRTYRVSVAARITPGMAQPSGSVGWPMYWFRKDGSSHNGNWPAIYYSNVLASKLTDEWQIFTADVTALDDAARLRPRLYGGGGSVAPGEGVDFDDVRVVDVTELRLAEAAAVAAQERAEEAYGLAESKPGMDEVNQAIVVSANGKNAITVSADAPTASTPGAVVGDTWWRVDAAGDIFGQWSWTGSAWSAREILSDVIANLDVGKLTVTGTSRFTTAVVDRLFADIFSAHKITANELTIAALDEDGEIKPDSVDAVMIKDGAISANKILLLGDPNDPDEAALVATIASIMKLAVENLVVTEGATISEAVIEKLAAQMITAGVIRTAESGQRVVIDQSGIVMYGRDEDDLDYEMVRIGPSGDNLITLGDTTVSASGIQAPSGEFEQIAVAGEDLSEILSSYGRGVIGVKFAGYNSAWHGTNTDVRRLEAEATLLPGRRYRIVVDSHYVQLRSGTSMTYVEQLRQGLPGSIQVIAENRWTMDPTTVEQTVGPLVGWIDTRDLASSTQEVFGLTVRGPEGRDHRIVASQAAGLRITIEDTGPSIRNTGTSYMDEGTPAEGTASAPPKETPTKRYTKTYSSVNYYTYDNNGNATSDPDVVQGLYAGGPSSRLRKGGWTFPSMTGDLAGATIEKVVVKLYMNHSYYTAGATVNVCTWGGVLRDTLTVQRTVTGWKRNTSKWLELPSSTFAGFKSGAIDGIGVKPTTTFAEQYARFATSAKIEITFVK